MNDIDSSSIRSSTNFRKIVMSRSVLLSASALVVATLMLGACSKSAPSSDTSASASKPSLSSALSPAAVQQAAKTASLPQPDLATPDSAYVEISKGSQLLFLYAAFSGLPANYDKMAESYSIDYYLTSDAFKKHDLLKTLQPSLDAGVADAKAHRYITYTDDSPEIGHYDFANHTFAVGETLFQQGQGIRFSDSIVHDGSMYELSNGISLVMTNGEAFQQLHVTDQAKARAIEATLGQLHMRIFAFIQSTGDNGYTTVQAVVTKVQLLDLHGQVLLEDTAAQNKGEQ
ncbi:DUF4852 domain-containing protein [Rhodanobacter denitrificans]|nr:DUF4852 domain-containing protein [Rhodanobacter denitrificans]UJM85501.1 DUF4852 domain-containing protein [Rhodanobacter denitrificans]